MLKISIPSGEGGAVEFVVSKFVAPDKIEPFYQDIFTQIRQLYLSHFQRFCWQKVCCQINDTNSFGQIFKMFRIRLKLMLPRCQFSKTSAYHETPFNNFFFGHSKPYFVSLFFSQTRPNNSLDAVSAMENLRSKVLSVILQNLGLKPLLKLKLKFKLKGQFIETFSPSYF